MSRRGQSLVCFKQLGVEIIVEGDESHLLLTYADVTARRLSSTLRHGSQIGTRVDMGHVQAWSKFDVF